MKKFIILLVIFPPLFLFSYSITPSRIKQVILFPDKGIIEREATAEVEKGIQSIVLETTAFNLDKNSLSVEIIGEGEILGVQYREIYLKEEPIKDIKKIEENIHQLEIKKNHLSNRLLILEKKEKFLDLLSESFKNDRENKEIRFPDIEYLDKILSFLDEQLSKIYQEKESLSLTIDEMTKEIEVLKRTLSSLKSPHEKKQKLIEILFNSKKEQKINLQVGYLVYNCGWEPLYKVNVFSDLPDAYANLVMFARINQKTGENWKNVKLTISNAVLPQITTLPTPEPWYLDIIYRKLEEEKAKRYNRRVEAKKEIILSEDKTAAIIQPEKRVLPVSFEYEFTEDITINSGQDEIILPLFEKKLKGEFFYYSVPQKTSLAFFVFKAIPDAELISGKMDIFFNKRFTVRSYLSEKKAGEPFYLNLGIDRSIKIKKIKVKDKKDETIFRKVERKQIIRDIEYRILIENLKDNKIKIQVIDSIPVSRTDKIEVKNVELSPKPDIVNYQKKEGVNLWEFEVEGKGKKEIDIKFTVVYPKDIYLIEF